MNFYFDLEVNSNQNQPDCRRPCVCTSLCGQMGYETVCLTWAVGFPLLSNPDLIGSQASGDPLLGLPADEDGGGPVGSGTSHDGDTL